MLWTTKGRKQMTYAPEVLTALRAVRELISVPERWTKGAGARKANGYRVKFSDPGAVCFCLMGAMSRCSLDSEVRSQMERVINSALDTPRPFGYIDWQDRPGRTHPEVLAVVDRAIVIAGGGK